MRYGKPRPGEENNHRLADLENLLSDVAYGLTKLNIRVEQLEDPAISEPSPPTAAPAAPSGPRRKKDFAEQFPESCKEPGLINLRVFVWEFHKWLEDVANSFRGAGAKDRDPRPDNTGRNGPSCPPPKE